MAKPTTRIGRDDDVARHLSRSNLEVNPDTGDVIGVLHTGLQLRVDRQEKELSVNHLQHFRGDLLDQLKALKADRLADGCDVRAKSICAVLGVGEIEDCGKASDLSLAVYERPLPGNPSHADLRGLPADNGRLDVLEGLAKIASKRMFRAGNL